MTKMTHAKTKGFSLLELIVALGIFAVIAGNVVAIFSRNSELIDRQKMESEAYILAESKLDEMLVATEAASLPSSGNIESTPYRFRIDISEQSYPGEARSYQLLYIVVSIFWGEGDYQDEVSLKTLKTEQYDK